MKRCLVSVLAALAVLGAMVTIRGDAPAGAQVQAQGVTTSPGVPRGWGSNGNSQIGLTNTALCTTSPSAVCPTPYPSNALFGITQASAGRFHTLFLKADGTVWAVGNNQQAQLGNNPSGGGDVSTPVQAVVAGGQPLTGVVAISAGPYHSLALDDDGHVWQWGQGNGTNGVTQVAGLSNVTAIAAGGDNAIFARHNLALLEDDTVVAWGSNGSGQLGDGTNDDSSIPVAVSGLSDVAAIAAGRGHSLALLEDGTMKAWGENEFGQLGDGTTTDRNAPVSVLNLTGITAIDAGGSDSWSQLSMNTSHSVAVKNDGTVWAWGANYAGQLGNDTTNQTANSTPVQAQGITTAVDVAAGGGHTLALLSDQTVRSWGSNVTGQLGDGTTTSRSTPGAVAFPAPVAPTGLIAAGANHSIAIAPLTSLGEYTSMTPARFLDTRPSGVTVDGLFKGIGKINAGSSTDVQITGRNGIPSTGVSAVVLNATMTEPTDPSFLTVWPTGFTRPTASNLNNVPGETVPNLVTVGVGVGGKVSVYNHNGSTHVVFDVVGYYSSITGPDGTRVHMITPARLMDTRGSPTIDGQFQGGGAIGQNLTRDLDVTGRGGVPASNVTAVVVNLTATGPTMDGFVTAFPGDVATKPNASNLNFVAGETVPNLAIVRVPASGIVKLYNFLGSTHLVVDVVGYYDDDEATDAGRVIPLFPGRLFDTRLSPFGPVPPGFAAILDMGSFNAGITNSQASGYVINTTVTQPTGPGFLTVHANDVVRPLASNLNFVPGQTVPNLVMTRVGCRLFPKINFYNSPGGFTHVLADAFGVITNSLAEQTEPCVPVFTGEVGAEEALEFTAPSEGGAQVG